MDNAKQIALYKELIKNDKEKLKNSYGGEAEEILQNLQANKSKLRTLINKDKTKV